MDWQIQLSTYLGALAAVLTTGGLLDSWMDADARREFGRRLQMRVQSDPAAWVRATNQGFLQLFDRLFGARRTPSRSLAGVVWWAGLLVVPGIIGFRLVPLVGQPVGRVPDAMIGDIGVFSLAAVATIAGVLYLFHLTGSLTNRYQRWLAIWLDFGLGAALLGLVVYIIVRRLITTGPVYIPDWQVVVFLVGTAMVTAGLLLLLIRAGFPFERVLDKLPVHPLKAITASLIFLVILGALNLEASQTFFEAVKQDKVMLGVIGFNVFADVFSLVETRWILERGARGGILWLPVLLVLDAVITALIFLVLPSGAWETGAILDGVLFRGERAWLGILFWTTFSTSFLFYAFVLSALLIQPLAAAVKGFGWLTRPFDLETHPIRCLAVAMALVVTMGSVTGGILQVV